MAGNDTDQLDLVQIALSVPPDRTTDFTTASTFPADLKLIVRNFSELTPSKSTSPTTPQESAHHIFIASSLALCNGTAPWAAMLSDRFPHLTLNGYTLLDFTQDDYGALVILMRIVHYQWASVPRSMSLDKLYDLCLLSDRYMATKLLAPWVENWSAPVREAASPKSLARTPGSGVAVALRQGGCEQKKLWIAWELGMSALFAELVKSLSGRLWIDNEGKRWIGPPQKDYKPPTKGWFDFAVRSRRSGEPLSREVFNPVAHDLQSADQIRAAARASAWLAQHKVQSTRLMEVLPLGVEDFITSQSRDLFASILNAVYEYLEQLHTAYKRNRPSFDSLQLKSGPSASDDEADGIGLAALFGNSEKLPKLCQHDNPNCLRMQRDSLLIGLKRIGVYPHQDPQDLDHITLQELRNEICDIKVDTLPACANPPNEDLPGNSTTLSSPPRPPLHPSGYPYRTITSASQRQLFAKRTKPEEEKAPVDHNHRVQQIMDGELNPTPPNVWTRPGPGRAQAEEAKVCGCWDKILEKVRYIGNGPHTVLSSAQIRHMQIQREKMGIPAQLWV